MKPGETVQIQGTVKFIVLLEWDGVLTTFTLPAEDWEMIISSFQTWLLQGCTSW
jgi:hypothetical protein